MNKLTIFTAALAIATAAATAPVYAQMSSTDQQNNATSTPADKNNIKLPEKHDSNTLHKIGKAIQYPVRKAGENLSTDVHRTAGEHSVHHDRNTATNKVVTGSGHTYVVSPGHRVGSGMYAHRRHYSRYHRRHVVRHHRAHHSR